MESINRKPPLVAVSHMVPEPFKVKYGVLISQNLENLFIFTSKLLYLSSITYQNPPKQTNLLNPKADLPCGPPPLINNPPSTLNLFNTPTLQVSQ